MQVTSPICFRIGIYMPIQSKTDKDLFTIGHSTHSIDVFINLLRANHVDTLIDTRSYPFSKYASQFNQDSLGRALEQNATKYLFLGKELGGRPKDPTFYDEDGHVLYWKVAASRDFQLGVEQLLNHITKSTVALLCSEENPYNCHRRLLIGRVLRSHGICVKHIRGDGMIQPEYELEFLNSAGAKQLSIFSQQNEEKTWRSTQSVLQKKPLLNSLTP
jgi:uncharacterized protein (DUF488 family)